MTPVDFSTRMYFEANSYSYSYSYLKNVDPILYWYLAPTSGYGSGLVGRDSLCRSPKLWTGLAPWTSGYIIGIFIRLFRDVLYPCRFRLTLPRRPPLLHSFRVFTTVMTLNKQRIELKSTLSTVFASSLLQNCWKWWKLKSVSWVCIKRHVELFIGKWVISGAYRSRGWLRPGWLAEFAKNVGTKRSYTPPLGGKKTQAFLVAPQKGSFVGWLVI